MEVFVWVVAERVEYDYPHVPVMEQQYFRDLGDRGRRSLYQSPQDREQNRHLSYRERWIPNVTRTSGESLVSPAPAPTENTVKGSN